MERFREKLARELRTGLGSILVLLVIVRRGPIYGYRLLRTLADESRGRFELQEGTAYPILQNLEKSGLVEAYWGEGGNGPPRKYYQATAAGRKALRAALVEWDAMGADVRMLVKKLEENA